SREGPAPARDTRRGARGWAGGGLHRLRDPRVRRRRARGRRGDRRGARREDRGAPDVRRRGRAHEPRRPSGRGSAPRRVPVHARGLDAPGLAPLVRRRGGAGEGARAVPRVRRRASRARDRGRNRHVRGDDGGGARQRRTGDLPAVTIAERWLDHLAAERGLAPHTLAAYGRDLALLQAPLDATPVEDARYEDLTAVLRRLRSEGRSPRSVARWLVAVRGFYAWLVSTGELEESPAGRLDAPRLWSTLPKVLDGADVERL